MEGARIQFSMDIPADWKVMDFSRRGRQDYAKEQSMRIIEQVPALHIYRKKLEDTLFKELTSSWAMGVRYGASLAVPTTDGLLSASITVSVLPPPPGQENVSVFDAIAATVHQNDEESSGDSESDISQVSIPEAGMALRVLGHRVLRPQEASQGVKYSIFQTYVPFGGRIVLVMGQTFCMDVETQLFELFDLITGTLSLRIDGGDQR